MQGSWTLAAKAPLRSLGGAFLGVLGMFEADPFRRFFPICCLMSWTERSDAGTTSFATQMIAIST